MVGSSVCRWYVYVSVWKFWKWWCLGIHRPHPRGRQVGEVSRRDKKNHLIVSLNQMYWEPVWVYKEEYVSPDQRAV